MEVNQIVNYILQDPIPAKPWIGNVLDATKEGPSCLQYDLLYGITLNGQEDCLVLNVYTHNVINERLITIIKQRLMNVILLNFYYVDE